MNESATIITRRRRQDRRRSRGAGQPPGQREPADPAPDQGQRLPDPDGEKERRPPVCSRYGCSHGLARYVAYLGMHRLSQVYELVLYTKTYKVARRALPRISKGTNCGVQFTHSSHLLCREDWTGRTSFIFTCTCIPVGRRERSGDRSLREKRDRSGAGLSQRIAQPT